VLGIAVSTPAAFANIVDVQLHHPPVRHHLCKLFPTAWGRSGIAAHPHIGSRRTWSSTFLWWSGIPNWRQT